MGTDGGNAFMNLFEPQAEDYLEHVKDWTDPNPRPNIQKFGKFWVVLDNELVYGSKIRFIDKLIKTVPTKEWVYGGATKVGYGPISLAAVCKKYGKVAKIYAAARKEPTEQQLKAIELGANYEWLKFGPLSVCEARARLYVEEDPFNRRLLPIGLEHPMVFGSIIKVARDPYFLAQTQFSEIWCAAGSGTLARGLALAFPEKDVNIVQIGHKLSDREIGRAKLYVSPYKYDQEAPIDELPPFPSTKYYDGKCWSFMQKYAKDNALFWNVA